MQELIGTKRLEKIKGKKVLRRRNKSERAVRRGRKREHANFTLPEMSKNASKVQNNGCGKTEKERERSGWEGILHNFITIMKAGHACKD